MKKIHFLLVFLATLTTWAYRIKCEPLLKTPPIRLRSFIIEALKSLSELRKAYDLREKLQEEIERKRKQSNMRIIQGYMDAKRLSGQRFLLDFHTARF
jgi:hypothetical protein